MKSKSELSFKKDINKGLSSSPKYIPSKYFYDDEGSRLFQLIMKSPDYYLTDCEYEIFSEQTEEIIKAMSGNNKKLRLIDFGAGDGSKTMLLLKEFKKFGVEVSYTPVDISEKAIKTATENILKNIENQKVEPIRGEYSQAIKEIDDNYEKMPKIILFLGSNIGNFTSKNAVRFLSKLHSLSKFDDKLFIGFDLKKNPKKILKAYNDRLGVTKKFNLNLLERINHSLDGDFDLDQFDHYNTYDPISGTARSFIISLKNQQVNIKKLGKIFPFEKFEAVYVEQSQKYSLNSIQELAQQSNFTIDEHFYDKRKYYLNSLWSIK